MADPIQKAKTKARSDDAAKREGITSLTGKVLEGDKLAKFKAAYDKSTLLQGTYNPDGTLKEDVKAITE